MKRLIAIISFFVVFAGLLAVVSVAEGEAAVSVDYGSVGDGVVAELLSDGTLLVRPSDTFSSENSGEMNDYKNTAAGRPPYYSDRSLITSIRVASGVTYVGDHAFRDIPATLTSVILEDGVEKIGDAAFNGATVECLYLPATLKNVMGSSGAPFANSEITNLYYSGSVAEWCEISFSAKTSSPTNYAENFYIGGDYIVDLVIPDGVTEITKYAFRGYKSLNSVTLPSSVVSVGNESFNQCTALKKIGIPSDLTVGSVPFHTANIESVVLTADEGESTVSGALLAAYKTFSPIIECEGLFIPLDGDMIDAMLASYSSAADSPRLLTSVDREEDGATRVTKISFDIVNTAGTSVFSFSGGRAVTYYLDSAIPKDAVTYSYDGAYNSIAYDETLGAVTVNARAAGALTVTEDIREKPKFTGAYVSLGDSISLIYRVDFPEDCLVTELSVLFEGEEYTLHPREVGDGVYDYRFTEIMPYQMNDAVTASLVAVYEDGKSVTVTHSGMSIRRYYELAARYYSEDAGLMTLLSDMLTYGAASQIYRGYKTDSLVTDGLTSLTPSEYSTAPSHYAISGESESARWRGASLYCTDSMGVYLTLSSDSDNLIARVTLAARSCEYDLKELEMQGNGMYGFLYTDIMAYEFSEVITAELISRDTGEVVSTLTYSVTSYVSENEDSGDTALVSLLKAIQCYGKSAAAYRGEL